MGLIWSTLFHDLIWSQSYLFTLRIIWGSRLVQIKSGMIKLMHWTCRIHDRCSTCRANCSWIHEHDRVLSIATNPQSLQACFGIFCLLFFIISRQLYINSFVLLSFGVGQWISNIRSCHSQRFCKLCRLASIEFGSSVVFVRESEVCILPVNKNAFFIYS